MKGIHGSIVALLIAACTPPSVPSKSKASPEALRSETVALVRNEGEDDEINFAAFCSGVWVSDTEILSANHCTHNKPIGTWMQYATSEDVFVDDGTLLRQVKLARGATIKRRDAKHDLVLLAAEPAPAHPFARVSTTVRVGAPTEAVGQSLGLLWWSYSTGVISAVRQLDAEAYDEDDPQDPKMKWVQTTAPISPGNSGGGLFDADGNLIGICSASFPRGENLNIFVHPEYIQSFLSP